MARSSFDPPKYQSVHDVVMELVQNDSDTLQYKTHFQPKVGEVYSQIAVDNSRKEGVAADTIMFINQGMRIGRNLVDVEYQADGQSATITIEGISDIRGTASALKDTFLTLTMLRNRPEFSIDVKSESLEWRMGIKCIVTIKKL